MDEREEKAAGMSAAVARCGYLIRYIICYLISYRIRYSPSAYEKQQKSKRAEPDQRC